MKKSFLLLIITLISLSSILAQSTQKELDFSGFNGVLANGIFSIELSKGDAERVTVEADSQIIPYIRVSLKNSILYLELDSATPKDLIKESREIKTYVEIKELVSINLSEASKLYVKSHFTLSALHVNMSGATLLSGLELDADRVELSLSGASAISIGGSVKEANYNFLGASNVVISHQSESVTINASGASKVILKGEGAENMTLKLSDASKFDFYQYPVNNLILNGSGVCNVKANVVKTLSVSLSGGSKFYYSGDPQINSLDISSISIIEKIN